MKLMAGMIAALSLISTTYAQGQHTHNERKSEPMQTTLRSMRKALLATYGNAPASRHAIAALLRSRP